MTSTLSVVMAFLVVFEKHSRGSSFTCPIIGVAQVVQAQLEALRRGDVFRAAENSAAFFKLMRLLATRVVEVGTTPPSSPGAWVLATARGCGFGSMSPSSVLDSVPSSPPCGGAGSDVVEVVALAVVVVSNMEMAPVMWWRC